MHKISTASFATFVGVALALMVAVSAGAQDGSWDLEGRTQAQRDAFEELGLAMSEVVASKDVPSVSIAFVDAKGLIWASAQGFADPGTRRKATIDTPYGIGSISKTFIGAALMTEIEQGRVALDRSLNDSLPFEVANPRAKGGQIEVRHIVTHSSGIRDHRKTYPKSYADGDPDADFGAWLERYLTPTRDLYDARGNFLSKQPGEAQVYSNIAATVGALVVEHSAGKPYAAVVEERLFDPLSMNQTGFMIADFPPGTIAIPHQRKGGELVPIPLFGYATYPDGQIRSSARDLAQYLQMLLDGGRYGGRRVLAESSVERLFSPVLAKSEGKEETYGVYWPLGPNRTAQHSGGDPGILALVAINRDRGIGFVYLQNTDSQRAIKTLGPMLSAVAKSFPLPEATPLSE